MTVTKLAPLVLGALLLGTQLERALAASPQDGAAKYQQFCAICHGTNLQGGMEGGEGAPALLSSRWTKPGGTKELERIINTGSADGRMPAWGKSLSAADIHQIADYIQKRNASSKENAPPGKGADSVNQVWPAEPPAFTCPRSNVSVLVKSNLYTFRAEPVPGVFDGYTRSMTVLPDGRLLVAAAGALRVVENGALKSEAIEGVPKNTGLYSVAIHPDYNRNGWIYVSYGIEAIGAERNKMILARGHIRDSRWTDSEILSRHGGMHITFDGNGYVHFAVGNADLAGLDLEDFRAMVMRSQDLTHPAGKTYRLHDDGRIPADNPFVHRSGALPYIWSYGHRNLSGMAFDKRTGELWTTEHGPWGGDELNRIKRGGNYGWPIISQGRHYEGLLPLESQREGMEQPVFHWTPSVGVSSVLVYDGAAFPKWRGQLFVGSMSSGRRGGHTLYRFDLQNGRAVDYSRPRDAEGRLLKDEQGHPLPNVFRFEAVFPMVGRIRTMTISPEGYFYLLTECLGELSIIRLVPAE